MPRPTAGGSCSSATGRTAIVSSGRRAIWSIAESSSSPSHRWRSSAWCVQSDVGVLMTNPRLANEGLSNSIMEYMAVGLPVVCGDGGGNPELVRDGVTGLIVPPGDADALADRLVRLRSDPALRAAMGDVGRARILSDFSVERMVRGMLRVYAEALGRPRG